MILVTRPEDASLRTKARLQAAGRHVLVDPLLDLQFAPPAHLFSAVPDALVITSANGAHAIAGHPNLAELLQVPVWTVGGRTSVAVSELGFRVAGEAPDVAHLTGLLRGELPQSLLYLAAKNRAGELSELLPEHRVETVVVYSTVPGSALAERTVEALRAGRIANVLHYSRRLAETYVALARDAGIEDEAFAPAQLCLSGQVAAPLLEAGAVTVRVAEEPREDALLSLLGSGSRLANDAIGR